ncbi:putative ABC transport system permease protein [Mucilaginibacter gossypiicola]|uniref:Putative ABC transport system permease protein n=1 Tax=Mucilaginibacter gossypiicola TaxID=551995 RepID=A0A1H7ZHH5_9SPHI|nr:ABC transporter permease [Mucilaginibacter gossypiicola]SEM56877.1 putative ABC transport system permease protein [Mucilaginibacter gossypiicola]
MFRNYLKTAFRTLRKNVGFTVINILGLALGLATCLMIVLYVADELSYDRFNDKANRTYRVNEDLKFGNNNVLYAVAMPPLAQALKTDLPEVEEATRLKAAGGFHAKKGNESILEYGTVYADPSVFNVFTLPMVNGNPATALKEPNTVVITESAAKKYFNSTNAVGKTLAIDNNQLLKVTGVIKDLPKQSHFHFDFFMSMVSWPDSRSGEWLRSDYNTYVVLKPGTDYKLFEKKLAALLKKYSEGQMQTALHVNIADFEKSGSYFRLNLTPLTDIHLHSNRTGELGSNSSAQYVYIFSAIAIFILLIAGINFMNLSTARSANRAREVGVRKVLGSPRKYLIAQFLTESVLVTLAAAVIAFFAVLLLLPLFNQVSGKELVVGSQTLAWLLPALLLIVLVVGFAAGSYPAFFLSAFQPINVLSGKLAGGFKGSWLRSVLVVFQFSISIFLIIGTIVIYNQLNYIQTKNLGYNRNQVLVINNAFELGSHTKTFKNEVKQLHGVVNATLTGYLPTGKNRGTSIFYKEAAADQKTALFPQSWRVDADYINTLGMKISAGRDFSANMPTDSTGLVINETAAKFLGFTNPVNKILYRNMDGNRDHIKAYHIIGVVKDFNFNSLRENISPMIFLMDEDNGNLSVRLNTANLPALIDQIKTKWQGMTQSQFSYSFMDQDFDANYRAEQRTGTISIIFTVLAISIACLGLFGLAAYAAEQRTKEIGIRKVLGASVSAIVNTLSKDFIKLVLISIAITTPLAWYLMNKWLQDFAYRISIQWWVLVLAGAGAVVIAIVTVSFQSVKAALANPINSLKNE